MSSSRDNQESERAVLLRCMEQLQERICSDGYDSVDARTQLALIELMNHLDFCILKVRKSDAGRVGMAAARTKP